MLPESRIVMMILPQLEGLGYIPSQSELFGAWEKITALKRFMWMCYLGGLVEVEDGNMMDLVRLIFTKQETRWNRFSHFGPCNKSSNFILPIYVHPLKLTVRP